MSRICFVIMPFSDTESCTEEEWTRMFEELLKPAIEGAGLDYECRRSVATRGNIVGAILQDLRDAHVVLADLTDRNANVFYELGVRHSLTDRTIILAQKLDDIPFDLRAYACHVYDGTTDEGRTALASKLAVLLAEVDSNPDRPDNPVSDFLGRREASIEMPEPVEITPAEVAEAQPLGGPGAEGLDAVRFARKLADGGSAADANLVFRLTSVELQAGMKATMETLGQRPVPQPVQTGQIAALAHEYITTMEPYVQKVEQFALTCVERDWPPGTRMGLRLAGKWISLSEKSVGIKFARGVPALLGWRLLVLMGAKAMLDDAFLSLQILLQEPVEVEDVGDRFSFLSLPHRHGLFHPDAFLGHATIAIDYVKGLWEKQPHLQQLFGPEEEYYLAISMFLIVVALKDSRNAGGYPLYPGYRLLPQATRAMKALCSRLYASGDYLGAIAKAMGETSAQLLETWSERVKRANSAKLGSGYRPSAGPRFPDPVNAGTVED